MATPSDNSSSDAMPTHPAGRGRVMAACLFAAAVFIGCVALLYAGWGGRDEASGLIIVQGDASVDDAIVTLYRTTDRGQEKYLSAQVNSTEDRRLRFHVAPGEYQVVVDYNGRPVLRERVLASDGGNVPLISFTLPKASTRSAAR